jgi:hypothetical protein
VGLEVVVEVEPGEDPRHVGLDGALRDEQPVGDRTIAGPSATNASTARWTLPGYLKPHHAKGRSLSGDITAVPSGSGGPAGQLVESLAGCRGSDPVVPLVTEG